MTKFRNDIFIENFCCYVNIVEIKTNREVYRSEIDCSNISLAAQYRFCPKINRSGGVYFQTESKGGGRTSLHRLIMGLIPGDGNIVDHIDRNTLNCKRDNLRLATYSQSNANRKKQSNKTSKYLGVAWHKGAKKWRAQIQINGKKVYLGLFVLEEDAATVYNDAALSYFEDFAKLNSVDTIVVANPFCKVS